MRIDKWKILPCVSIQKTSMSAVVQGRMYGHPRIADGEMAVTSPIEIFSDGWAVDAEGNTYELGSKG